MTRSVEVAMLAITAAPLPGPTGGRRRSPTSTLLLGAAVLFWPLQLGSLALLRVLEGALPYVWLGIGAAQVLLALSAVVAVFLPAARSTPRQRVLVSVGALLTTLAACAVTVVLGLFLLYAAILVSR